MNLSTPASYTNVTKCKKDNPKQILANQTKKAKKAESGESEESQWESKKAVSESKKQKQKQKRPSPFSKVQIVFIVRWSFIETKLKWQTDR